MENTLRYLLVIPLTYVCEPAHLTVLISYTEEKEEKNPQTSCSPVPLPEIAVNLDAGVLARFA